LKSIYQKRIIRTETQIDKYYSMILSVGSSVVMLLV
jgi:hypothetical protein